jgi:hypothetical protein
MSSSALVRTGRVSKAPPKITVPVAEITRDGFKIDQKTGKYTYDDSTAAAIALRDYAVCDNYVAANNWALYWTDADKLYQSPQSMSPFGQGIGTRASVPNFLISNAMDAVCPKIIGGLLGEDPPFLLRPRPGTDDETIRAKTAIFAYQLEDMNFGEQVEYGVYDCALLGTVIYKWGWHEEQTYERHFKRKADPTIITTEVGHTSVIHTEDSDAIEFEMIEKSVRRPYLEKKDLARVFGDPHCKSNDVRRAKWTVEHGFTDWEGLELLRTQPDYTVPSRETLIDWFFRDKFTPQGDNITMSIPEGMKAYLVHAVAENFPVSADPMRASLEIIERQDAYSIVVILRHGNDIVVIRNSVNPFAHIAKAAGGTGHCYLSSVWRPIRDSQYGQGMGQILGGRQMVAQGTENLALEVLAYPLHPTFTRLTGWNALPQNIQLGSGDVLAVEGDDVRKGIGLLDMPEVPNAAWETLRYNKAEALESAGVNTQVTMGAGGPPGQSTGMRSGTGSALVGKAAESRLDGPVERIIRQVFVPWLQIMDALNNELLPAADMREILTEKGFQSARFDHVIYRNARMSYEVLAGAHLGPKREMTTFMAAIEQIAINPALLEAAADADMKFNFADWFKSYAELSGFKFSQQFFVQMTAQEKQRRDRNSPAAIAQMKQQGVSALQKQKDDAKSDQIFNSALARAGEKATVLQTEHALLSAQEPIGEETEG